VSNGDADRDFRLCRALPTPSYHQEEAQSREETMFILLLPAAILSAVGLAVVHTIEAVERSFKGH
jgi:hypothetical protein